MENLGPRPPVIESQIKSYFQICFNVKKCVVAQAILRVGSMIFKPKHFFHNQPLHTEVHKNSERLVHPSALLKKLLLISSMSISK